MNDDKNRVLLNLVGAFVAAGLLTILGFVTWALVFWNIPEQNINNLTLLIGNLVALVGLVVGFYFGSSSENKKLAEAVNMQAKTAQAAGAALGGSEASTTVLLPGDNATVEPKIDGATVITKHPGDGL